DSARALGDVGLGRPLLVHLEVLVGATAEQLRAARPEVGEPGDELCGRRARRLVEVDRGHAYSSVLEDIILRTVPKRLVDLRRYSTEPQLELELVRDSYSVLSELGDRGLQVAACVGDGVTVEGDDLHAPALIELQRAQVGVRRDQPEPRAASLDGDLSD